MNKYKQFIVAREPFLFLPNSNEAVNTIYTHHEVNNRYVLTSQHYDCEIYTVFNDKRETLSLVRTYFSELGTAKLRIFFYIAKFLFFAIRF